MSKVLKRILISICGAFAFLFAGFFFVGCQVDYNKIQLVADQTSLNLEVGESVDVVFTIENFQKGFSNKVRVNPRADGQTAVFSCSNPVYIGENKIKISVTGVAGGHGELSVTTLEAGKECIVDVDVTQYSNSMQFNNDILYVSNKTDFVPNSNLFTFDVNTTYKELSYYYLQPKSQINFNTFYLNSVNFAENLVYFTDGVGSVAEANVQQFDRMKLKNIEGTNKLYLSLSGQETEIDFTSEFLVLSVYDYSLNNESYDRIVYAVSSGYVLPNIDAKISGGYINMTTGYAEFKPIEENKIKIVPNNNDMLQYVLKIEMNSTNPDMPLKMSKVQSNYFVDVDFFDYAEPPDTEPSSNVVYYLKVSQNSQTQNTTNFTLNIFYDIAQGLDDESVNVEQNFVVDIEIAPSALMVNGTTEPENLILYNFYLSPEFGWNDLVFDVISGFDSSPNYDGIYFTFDNRYLDMIYEGITVVSGDSKLYKDLSKPFQIRGIKDAAQIETELIVHLKSSILYGTDELTLVIKCNIIAGATELKVDVNYEDNRYFYIDYDAGEVNFNKQIFANQIFKNSTCKLTGGVDVLNFNNHEETPYEQVEDKFYLNLSAKPKATGIGTYRVLLDNGMYVDLHFNVIRTLKPESTQILLTNEGNEAVTNFSYSRQDGVEYDNVLNIEILNPSNKDSITFGNNAFIDIVANLNADSIKLLPDVGQYISISKVNSYYRFATLENGDTIITVTLSGLNIEDFSTKAKELVYIVNVSSYSLVSEYYLKNGENFALNSTVYYDLGEGTLKEEDTSVTLTAIANNSQSSNFYQYSFKNEAFVDIFENAVEQNIVYVRYTAPDYTIYKEGSKYYVNVNGRKVNVDSDGYELDKDGNKIVASSSFSYNIDTQTQLKTELVHSKYNKKFIYFFAQDENGNVKDSTMTEVTITKRFQSNGEQKELIKKVMLVFDNGLMFLASDLVYEEKNEIGEVVATYLVSFSNFFSISVYGDFDVETLTYKNRLTAVHTLVLNSNLRQRNSTNRYDARITSAMYQSVESISLASGLTNLDFTNNKLSYTLGVYTFPSNSTNKNIRVEFITTRGNTYTNMVTWEIDNTEKDNGVYTVTLSCESFYNSFENKGDIVDIQTALTGKIYIYPAEWGDNYTSISSSFKPICLDVQYRNGSVSNPYLLETAADVVNINSNETTLKSHYEVRTVIDMSSVNNCTPIGILNVGGKNKLVGFSGSIVGFNSQAAITNIVVSQNNWTSKVDLIPDFDTNAPYKEVDLYYSGLFAQINAPYMLEGDTVSFSPKIENLNISGKFDLNLSGNSYVGLVTAVNKGSLINVGTKISKSTINGVMKTTLYFGGIAGVNYGNIIQDFTKYDGTNIDGQYDFTNQNTKIMAYFLDKLTINAPSMIVYAGGIAGASNGVVERINSTILTLYGYSSYSAFTLIDVVGEKNFDTHKNIYIGGAVGVVSYYNINSPTSSMLPEQKKDESNNLISNLLVGGEINTSNTNSYIDHIGGIVGYADTVKISVIKITKNTSRMFLRGYEYVGGIVGYDYYIDGYGTLVDFENENIIEAIDDGRNSFYSSSIIRMKKLTNYPGTADSLLGERNIFFAVGNARNNPVGINRDYGSISFSAYTYLKRNFITVSTTDKIVTNTSSTEEFYGNYIVVEKNGDGSFSIDKAFKFTPKNINLGLDTDFKDFEMKAFTSNPTDDISMYFMYYFSVDGLLNGKVGASAQDDIEDLNYITPQSKFYPFKISSQSQDVSISSSNSNILSVDVNGNLTVKGAGLAVVTLSSILNIVNSRVIYIYIVNYFDKDIEASVFYTSNNVNGVNITDESQLTIYGNSNTNISLVPSYFLNDAETYNKDEFSVSKAGILNYKNVEYVLSKNTQMTVDSSSNVNFIKTSDTSIVAGKNYYTYEPDKDEYKIVANPVVEELSFYFEQKDYFSTVQINKQTVVFFKKVTPVEGEIDKYYLKPMLQVDLPIGNQKYTFYFELTKGAIHLDVNYKETATSIRTNFKYHSMQTNNVFTDTVTVESTNKEELLFYEVFQVVGENSILVQSRLPEAVGLIDNVDSWYKYINYSNNDHNTVAEKSNRLFDFQFERRNGAENIFDFSCKVDTNSKKFKNRFNENIFGEYVVHLYASELNNANAVSYSFRILLSEAEINYISVNNYSNLKDISLADDILVPSQRGMLEISLDPAEAVFDEFTISNNSLNYQTGATEATFMFMYEKISPDSSVEYVLAQNFGRYDKGVFKFKYQEMIDFFNEINKSAGSEVVSYIGKVYLAYYMPSNNVSDGVRVGFDIVVTYGNQGSMNMDTTILLTTKLGSYARLEFVNKQNYGGVYYVARGLSYDLRLNYYGFSENQISISSSNNFVAQVSGSNGNYSLNVTPESINYNNDVGYKLEIVTAATKVVDNVTVTTKDTLEIYVMEYVLDYVFVEGVNEDIVRGMENGIVYTAIGNPFELQFDIRKFLEYDNTNAVVNKEVETFVESMTTNIDWTVYYNDTTTLLEQDKTFKTDYYHISSFTVTPLKIYNAESDIYHFSAGAYYTMRNGVYIYSSVSANANPIYTEFAFEVHQQSTEDSPLPIETYDDFMDMRDGEWYILLKDIILPGSEYAVENDLSEFKPISKQIAGLDGNGYKFFMAGTYNFTGISNIGLFDAVMEDTIIKNVSVYLSNDVLFKTDMSTFNVGLITASNNGIISNCLVESAEDKSLSVICSTTATSSYVAGLVGNNTGFITNSRSKVNIFCNVNLSGFVGINSGVISSSYYMGGSLKNETNTTSEFTAGFAISNSGQINTSYVSGTPSSKSTFYDMGKNTIQSSNNITGFVYTNTGNVADCYSNIQLRQSGAFASGFVFENSGKIYRCISTSVLESRQTSNYGFARVNNINTETGYIEDCFYLQDASAETYKGDERIESEKIQGVNQSIGVINLDENTDIEAVSVTGLRYEDYDKEKFSNFVVGEGRNINSVWFYNKNQNDLSNFNGSVFNVGKYGRLELVAPNIVATSKRELDRIETIIDPTTGATSVKYIYVYSSGSPALGSVYNPILISDANTMENYILQENNSASYNYSYYRLIANVDYAEYIYNSKLYDTKFMGYLEGNFMSISNISLISSSQMSFAGMFAEVGRSTILNSVGTLMNFTYRPRAVSFANTNVVGALAGKVDKGNILNIDVQLPASDQLVVVGNNIVGGVIGLAVGEYKIQNITSQLSAKARNYSVSSTEGKVNEFDETSAQYAYYSFAGSIAGVLSGNGKVYNCVTKTVVSVLAHKAGLMFGLIDSGVSISKIRLDMDLNMLINPYNGYGGLVVGESKGTVSDVIVKETEVIDQYFTNFIKVPFIANAVGGFAGIISGGILDKITVEQSIQLSTQSSSTGIVSLGGVAGIVAGSVKMSNVTVTSNLSGFQYVGGIAGTIDSLSNVVTLQNINVDNCNLNVTGIKLFETGLGGLSGNVTENSIVYLLANNTEEINKNISRRITLENEIEELRTSRPSGYLEAISNKQDEIAELEVKYNSEMSKTIKNRFVVVATASIFVYDSPIHIYVGGIIGKNESTVPHLIYDTYSSVTGYSEVLDMSGKFDSYLGNTKVDTSAENPVLVTDPGENYINNNGDSVNKKVIETLMQTSSRCLYYCDVEFNTVKPSTKQDRMDIVLYLNLYGEPSIPI